METNQLVKDRLGLLAVIKQNPDIKEMLFNALKHLKHTKISSLPKLKMGLLIISMCLN